MLTNDSLWSPNLDALIAAPKHHILRMENDDVRVLETRIEPGETVPLHTHENPSSNYFLSWSDCVRRDENGDVLFDSRIEGAAIQPGEITWSGPIPPHTLENVGSNAIHLISTEIKPK
jgi:mannose-6-phosphate isomerase-like protein (cupin superfamily)